MSLRYGFEFGGVVLPVLGSVDGVVVDGLVVVGLFTDGLVALGSVGRPEVGEPVVGELLPVVVLGLAGLMAGEELPVALSVPSEPLLGVVPMVPVEPVEVPLVPVPTPEEPVAEEPVAGAPVAAPPAAPPAPAPAAPPPDWANAPAAASEPEARIVAANFPSRIFCDSSVRMKLRTGMGIV
jgi:pyruvate/2-oxoglutarate dehydrogenase complex dihydrolipoamide acyltransferase (E2) component